MIKRLQRSMGTTWLLMTPLLHHPYAILMIGFVSGILVTSGVKGDATQVVLGILAGLCLALVTMTAVWEHEDRRRARRLARRAK